MNERRTEAVERAPAEPRAEDALVLVKVVNALAELSPDSRKRVLHAAAAFYRVPT